MRWIFRALCIGWTSLLVAVDVPWLDIDAGTVRTPASSASSPDLAIDVCTRVHGVSPGGPFDSRIRTVARSLASILDARSPRGLYLVVR